METQIRCFHSAFNTVRMNSISTFSVPLSLIPGPAHSLLSLLLLSHPHPPSSALLFEWGGWQVLQSLGCLPRVVQPFFLFLSPVRFLFGPWYLLQLMESPFLLLEGKNRAFQMKRKQLCCPLWAHTIRSWLPAPCHPCASSLYTLFLCKSAERRQWRRRDNVLLRIPTCHYTSSKDEARRRRLHRSL